MFDDEAQSTVPAPTPTAPASEPAVAAAQVNDSVPDIFDGSALQPSDGGEHLPDASPETTVLGPSALDAGKLQAVNQPVPSAFEVPPGAQSVGNAADLHEPTALKRVILAAIILIVVALIGVAVWWFVVREQSVAVQPQETAAPAAPTAPAAAAPDTEAGGGVNVDVTEPVKPAEAPVAASENAPTIAPSQPTTQSSPSPTPAPAPTPDPNKDTDKDGLNDSKELQIGTSVDSPDTDSDGLTDGAEINIWGTNALSKDTDGDGFSDGQEVLNGYNPKGQGKLR